MDSQIHSSCCHKCKAMAKPKVVEKLHPRLYVVGEPCYQVPVQRVWPGGVPLASKSAPVDTGRGFSHTPSHSHQQFPVPGLGCQLQGTWVHESAHRVEVDDPCPEPGRKREICSFWGCIALWLSLLRQLCPYPTECKRKLWNPEQACAV